LRCDATRSATRRTADHSARRIAAAILLFMLAAALPRSSAAGERGLVEGADAMPIRAHQDARAPIVGTVEPGVPFSFAADDTREWAAITLDSGKSGWLPLAAIRLFFDDGALPRADPTGVSEIDEAARARGFDYVKVTRRAARGDAKALEQFFTLAAKADGGAAESITSIPTVVYHLLGDAKFAQLVSAQPVALQALVRNVVLQDGRLPPTTLYLQRHFPETTKVFFPSELVGWPSPNARYAIRKIFSDPFDMLGRAELIEKKTGQVLLDLSADEVGTGVSREGAILWSPDSKRFAILSIGATEQRGNLFSTPRPPPLTRQTAVYHLAGDAWRRVALPLDDVPGRKDDTELQNAILGHDYVDPARWRSPTVLVLERHEYYEKLTPTVVDGLAFESIVGLSRWYWITATIDPAGKTTLVWKRRQH
jgi:hypothetical protein